VARVTDYQVGSDLSRGLWAEILLIGALILLGVTVGAWLGNFWIGLSLGLALVVIRLFWVVMRLALWLEHPRSPIAGRYAAGWLGHLGQRLRRAHLAQRRRDRRWLRLIREYRRAADALPDAIVAMDQHHRILGFNPAARQLLGFRQRDLGLPVEHLLRQPDFIGYLRAADWSRDVDVPSDYVAGQVLSVHMVPYVQGRLLLIARDVTRLQRPASHAARLCGQCVA